MKDPWCIRRFTSSEGRRKDGISVGCDETDGARSCTVREAVVYAVRRGGFVVRGKSTQQLGEVSTGTSPVAMDAWAITM
jgi:hypothetical protein